MSGNFSATRFRAFNRNSWPFHTLSSEIVKGMDHGVSDTLYNARQYLQDRARYERLNLTVGREYVTMLQEMTA